MVNQKTIVTSLSRSTGSIKWISWTSIVSLSISISLEQFYFWTSRPNVSNFHFSITDLNTQNTWLCVVIILVVQKFVQSADYMPICSLVRVLCIFSLRNAICRLHKFPDWKERIYNDNKNYYSDYHKNLIDKYSFKPLFILSSVQFITQVSLESIVMMEISSTLHFW